MMLRKDKAPCLSGTNIEEKGKGQVALFQSGATYQLMQPTGIGASFIESLSLA